MFSKFGISLLVIKNVIFIGRIDHMSDDNHRNYTILLVEDDQNDRLLVKRAFKKARLSNPLSIVTDGVEAINYLSGDDKYSDREEYPLPMLILLDLKLPRKSGLDVLEWLKNQETLKRIPVVILTSSKESTDVNRAYDLGANSYLLKPVSFDGLTELVENLKMYWLILNEKPGIAEDLF